MITQTLAQCLWLLHSWVYGAVLQTVMHTRTRTHSELYSLSCQALLVSCYVCHCCHRYIEELINAEAAAGVPSERVVVAGFSQGGAVALMALRSEHKLAGVIGGQWWQQRLQQQASGPEQFSHKVQTGQHTTVQAFRPTVFPTMW